MKTKITRRQALKSGGAAIAATAGANDDKLLKLERQIKQAEAAANAACIKADEADMALPNWANRPYVEVGLASTGSPIFVELEHNIDCIEESLLGIAHRTGCDDGVVNAVQSFVEGRRKEYRRQAERIDAYRRECGLTALEEQRDAACERSDDLCTAAIDTPANSFDGIRTKHRILKQPPFAENPERMERLVASIGNDVERIGGAS